jgi:glucosamine 6-phosphate synthetase-like amidotransferase/phosphosugar isomerase protein
MCGIFGLIRSRQSDVDLELLNSSIMALAFTSEARGQDSFGVLRISDKLKTDIRKWPKAISRISSDPDLYKSLIVNHNTLAILGHTRAATGNSEVSVETAHPLVHEGWACTHNGIIYNYSQFYPGAKVDSLAIPAVVVKSGFKGLSELQGWLAIVLVNLSEPNNVYFLKHSAPLFYVFDRDLGLFVYASSSDFIRQTFPFLDEPVSLPENSLYKFDLNEFSFTHELDIAFSSRDAVFVGSMFWFDDDDGRFATQRLAVKSQSVKTIPETTTFSISKKKIKKKFRRHGIKLSSYMVSVIKEIIEAKWSRKYMMRLSPFSVGEETCDVCHRTYDHNSNIYFDVYSKDGSFNSAVQICPDCADLIQLLLFRE